MLKKIIINIAYFLNSSDRYTSYKLFFKKLLNDRTYSPKIIFDFFMIILVFISVWILLWEVKNPIGKHLNSIEFIILIIFILEYLARFWVFSDIHKIVSDAHNESKLFNTELSFSRILYLIVKDKLSYITSPLAIIDLLAITPDYRAIRFLRIFRIFRLFKLLRYTISVNEFLKILVDKKFEFYTLGIIIGFITFISSSVLYIFEANINSSIDNFFDTIYWSIVTISTVGFGDITPKTVEGKIVTIILILTGIGVISFSTSIIISAFNDKIYELKENKIKAKVNLLDNHIVICGFSYVGKILAKKLEDNKKDFLILDNNQTKVQEAQALGYLAFKADATISRILLQSGINSGANTLISLVSDEIINIYIVLTARSLNKNIKIISVINNRQSHNKFKLAGANEVFYPFEMVSSFINQYINQSIAFDAIYNILDTTNNVMINDFNVLDIGFFDNKEVKEIDFFKYKIVLLAIVRNNFDFKSSYIYKLKNNYVYFNPPQEFKIEKNDILILFSHTKGYLYFPS